MSKEGEIISPGTPGGVKRTAVESREALGTKVGRTELNTMNIKKSKSKYGTSRSTDIISDMEIEDDISSIDSNNLYYNLPQNSTGNENFEIRRTNNTKKKIVLFQKNNRHHHQLQCSG